MINLNTYIKEQFNTVFDYSLTDDDKKLIQIEGIYSYIWNKLTSRKFRKSQIHPDLLPQIQQKLADQIKQNKQIILAIPIGGYKKRELESAPFINWAEVFNLLFMMKLASPVLKVYKPGVEIEYISREIYMKMLGNYEREELRKYTESFQLLIENVKKYFPFNFHAEYREVREHFSEGEFEERIKNTQGDIDKLYEQWDKLPQEVQDQKINKAKRNYLFKGEELNLSEKEKYEILKKSVIMHDLPTKSILCDKDYIFNDNKIPVGYYPNPWGIHYGSCDSSSVQFWVGNGVLEVQEDKISQKILSIKQY